MPVRRFVVGPDIPVSVGGVTIGAGGDEPRVLVGGVIDDEVDDHPDPVVGGGMHQVHEVTQ
jgi:hypothetical protein